MHRCCTGRQQVISLTCRRNRKEPLHAVGAFNTGREMKRPLRLEKGFRGFVVNVKAHNEVQPPGSPRIGAWATREPYARVVRLVRC